MEDQVWRLSQGETVVKPTYDHASGTFGPPENISPRSIVVVRGLFPLFSERLRSAFGIRIWLDPQDELKWSWKVRRDCAQRGYSVPEVIRQIVERRDDQLAYIAPQKAHADVIVHFHPPARYFLPGTGVEHDDAHLNVRIHLHGRLPRLALGDVLATDDLDGRPAIRLVETGSPFALGDGRAIALEIDGTVSPALARELDERIWAHMKTHRHLRPDEIGGYLDGATVRHSDPLALTQLLIAYQIVRAGPDRAASAGPSDAAPARARLGRTRPAEPIAS